jgi:hypothetical protein
MDVPNRPVSLHVVGMDKFTFNGNIERMMMMMIIIIIMIIVVVI